MPEGRSDAAAAVIGGTVYIVGGRTWTPDSVFMDNSMWAYDAASDHWTIAAPIPTKRAFLAVGVVNGVLYAIGGDSSTGGQEGWGPCCLNTVEAYDPSTNTWTSKAPLHTPRAAAAAAVVNGTLYVFGGENNGAGLSSVEAYDPATDSWTELGSMPYSRLGMVAAASHGAIFALGGIARDEIVADNQAFVP
jgi:N-acetylneuraminic acid mutarotase